MKIFKIWIDEAGRWPWFGPVVACAFAFNPIDLPPKKFIQELNDSKKLSEKKREAIFWALIEMSLWKKPKIFFWVWVVDNFVIDEINIKQANKEAMRRALIEIFRKINRKKIKSIEIDGNDNYTFEELIIKPKFIIWWDGKVSEIGAASIIAKVFRDQLMNTYAKLYPHLWVEAHKWYGTKRHQEYLKDHSCITWAHRLSYKPVKIFLENIK